MYNNSLHFGRKHFCRYCLHAFITEEILKGHVKIALKLKINKLLRSLRMVNILNSKILTDKVIILDLCKL